MNRQGSGPGRGTHGRAADGARDSYLQDPYLDADAYPVDPGYRPYSGSAGRPRPADMPAGPRTRPERGMPPRPGYPPRASRQAQRDQTPRDQTPRDQTPRDLPLRDQVLREQVLRDQVLRDQVLRDPAMADRPWPGPGAEGGIPVGGRPRPRPGSPRFRPQPAGRPRPTASDAFDPVGRWVPPAGDRGRSFQGARARGVADHGGPGYEQVPPGRTGGGGAETPRAGQYPGGQPRAGQPQAGQPQAGQPQAGQPQAGQYGQAWQDPGLAQGYQGQTYQEQAYQAYQEQEQYMPGQQWQQPGQAGYPPSGPHWPGGGQGQPGPGQYAGDGQYGQHDLRNTGSWQAAGPGWPGAPGPGQPRPDLRNTGSWQAAGPDWPGAPGAGYPGDPRTGPGGQPGYPGQPGQSWAAQPGQAGQAQPGQPGPGVYSTGSWQAAGAGPYAPGNMRNTGSFQAAGPPPGPTAGPGWQGPASGAPEYGAGQYGAGQYGQQNMRNTGSFQAAGPGPQQGQPYAGQPYSGDPYAGQPFSGQPFSGQPNSGQPNSGQPHNSQPNGGQPHSAAGRLGDPQPGGPGPGLRNTGGFGRVGSPIIRQRDSALPDPPPSAPAHARGKAPIAAIETDNVAAFARDLRVLRAKAGLDYPDMAEKSHYTMRTLASAAGGLRLPTLPVLIAYVNACAGDIGDWEERWDRLVKSAKKSQAAASVPDAEAASEAAGSAAAGRPRIPSEARQTGEIYVITSARERDERW